MSNRVWVASELFYPIQTSTGYIMTEIAKELAKDNEVHVVCGPEEYGSGKTEVGALSDNIILHRVGAFGLNKDKLVTRAIRIVYLSFAIAWNIMIRAKRGEKVFMVTNPALLILLVSFLGKLKKYDVRILVHDVFPENLLAAGLLKRKNFAFKILQGLFGYSYRSAHKILVLGQDMKQVFLAKGVKPERISITENWADIQFIAPIAPVVSNKGVVIQFAGNMGRVQGLMEFAEAYKKAGCKQVQLDLIGDGAMKPELIAFKKAHAMKLLQIKPSFSRHEQSSILNSCDIALVCLANGMYGLGVPSKVYNILAAGKPVLYIGHPNSEVALMIKEHDLGWHFDDFDLHLVAFLRQLDLIPDKSLLQQKGKNARSVAEQYFSKSYILSKYKQAILQ